MTPEPWVAVATAPATEMWGSDARVCKATPSSCNVLTRWPYFTPPLIETVCASWSTTTSAGRFSSESSSEESAMSLNEWREPNTCTLAALATICCTCSSVVGRCSFFARYV